MNQSSQLLVTGADVFIGSHVVEALLKKGHKVKEFSFWSKAALGGE